MLLFRTPNSAAENPVLDETIECLVNSHANNLKIWEISKCDISLLDKSLRAYRFQQGEISHDVQVKFHGQLRKQIIRVSILFEKWVNSNVYTIKSECSTVAFFQGIRFSYAGWTKNTNQAVHYIAR